MRAQQTQFTNIKHQEYSSEGRESTTSPYQTLKVLPQRKMMYKITYKRNQSLGIISAQHKCKKIPLGMQMVFFAGLLHPPRAQDSYLRDMTQIVEDENPAYAIIKQLLFDSKNLGVQVQMINKLLQSSSIDVDMQFFLQLSLIAIKSLWRVAFQTLVFRDQLFYDRLRLTFSLHESQNMVNIVGHDVSFLGKGVGLCFFALEMLGFWFWGYNIKRGLWDGLSLDNNSLFFLYFQSKSLFPIIFRKRKRKKLLREVG